MDRVPSIFAPYSGKTQGTKFQVQVTLLVPMGEPLKMEIFRVCLSEKVPVLFQGRLKECLKIGTVL